MKTNLEKNFLVDSDKTGRFIVKSIRTGKKYFVEPVGDPHITWGSIDQASGKMSVKKGWKRYNGSVDASDSMVNEDNFDKVHSLKAGESPLQYIEQLDAKYPDA